MAYTACIRPPNIKASSGLMQSAPATANTPETVARAGALAKQRPPRTDRETASLWGWHEGAAGATVLTSLRCLGSGLASHTHAQGTLYLKPPICRYPSGSLRPDGAPRLLTPTGRFIKYNVALCIMWRRHWHASMLRCPLPSPTLGDCIFRANSPASRTPAPALRLGQLVAGGGSLSLAGTCPHAADGPQQLRATMTPAPFQNASRRSPSSPYVLKRRTAGLVMPHGGTPPTGHGPFGCPQPVWRAESSSSFHADRLFNDSP